VLDDAKKSPLCEHAFEKAKNLEFIDPNSLKNISSKTVVIDAIFGIGGRIDLGSEIEEILSACDRFESKDSHRCSDWYLIAILEKYLKHVLMQIKQLLLLLISLDSESTKVRIIAAS